MVPLMDMCWEIMCFINRNLTFFDVFFILEIEFLTLF